MTYLSLLWIIINKCLFAVKYFEPPNKEVKWLLGTGKANKSKSWGKQSKEDVS